MGWKFFTLPFLLYILKTVQAVGTWMEDCDGQSLLFSNKYGLGTFCPTTRRLAHFAEGDFRQIAYSPRNGGEVTALHEGRLATFVKTKSGDAKLLPHNVFDLKDPRHRCVDYIGGHPDSSPPEDIAIDWVTGVVYATHSPCCQIRAYDLTRSLFATVYQGHTRWLKFLATHPTLGYLLWTQDVRDEYGRSSYAIHRASLDGTDIRLIVNGEFSIDGLTVDTEMSLVYWSSAFKSTIFLCDLNGNNRQKLNFSPQTPLNMAAHGNAIFWTISNESPPLYRAETKPVEKFEVILNGTEDTAYYDLEVIRTGNDDLILNPCANSSCSQMCVQSSYEKYACLCGENYVLQQDGHNCSVRTKLLISAPDGILELPTIPNATDPSGPKFLAINTSNPSHVQCDSARRRVFWAESDEDTTKILEADMHPLHNGTETVFERSHIDSPYASEELEAFALDLITGNLYLVFRGHRRILACSITDQNGTRTDACCAELFGNRVASSVGGLALDPTEGLIYWTQRDDDSLAVMKGSMDGARLEILRGKGLAQPTSIAFNPFNKEVYWVDLTKRLIEYTTFKNRGSGVIESSKFRKHSPQRIAIYDANLYWVGLATDGGSEAVFKLNFRTENWASALESELLWETGQSSNVVGDSGRITGISVFDTYAQAQSRKNSCGRGHPCGGICLLSGRESFRCVCPIGFQSNSSSGSSCQEVDVPTVVYGTKNGVTVMKDGSSESVISNGTVTYMAFDPRGRELYWSAGSECKAKLGGETQNPFDCHWSVQWVNISANATTVTQGLLLQDLWRSNLDITWLEYDWIGDNVYFRDIYLGVGLCRRASQSKCTILFPDKEVGNRLALDPRNGRMYWLDSAPTATTEGIWRGTMDGWDRILIIPSKKPKLLVIDHPSQLLFWAERRGHFSTGYSYEIFHSDLDGRDIGLTIRLQDEPYRISVEGSRLLWTVIGLGTLSSCNKETANNLMMHSLADMKIGQPDFVVISPDPPTETAKDLCVPDGVSSHLCVPTPSGYMRCLCPLGYKLMSNNWTCECNDVLSCDASKIAQQAAKPEAGSRLINQTDCPGDQFRCDGTCLDLEKLCNGRAECSHFSDEGERCHENCNKAHGCLHKCSRSPAGPICFCPPDQMLAGDKVSCIKLEIRTQEGATGKWKIALIIAGLVGSVLVIVLVLGAVEYRKTKRKLRDLTEQEVQEFLRGDPAGASVAPDGTEKALLLPYTHILAPGDIIMATGMVLGSGQFGIVHPGIYKSEPVAIKTFKRSVEVDEFKAVLVELKIMAYLGNHPYTIKGKIMIVTELSPHGDLLRYLWKVAAVGLKHGIYANITENPMGVTRLTLYSWCEQIAIGMEYLALKQIVHGDLAARNVLVFNDNVVKLSDFGLSKQLYGSPTYQMKKQRKLPWKWSSIELLTSMEYSEGSDVWAFGVTAWEIFSLGQIPYKGVVFGNEFIESLKNGNRLPQLAHASKDTYKVLLQCWDLERRNRPSFRTLKQVFHDLLTSDGSSPYLDLNLMESSV